MIEILKRIFKHQPNKKELNNKIIFEIQNENIKVDLLFNDTSLKSPKQIGEFLYYLNNGYYVTHILDILVSLSHNKPEYENFVHNIIDSWSSKLPLESHVEDTPVVPPTYFQQNTLYKKS
jgi:hypothetical protein